MTDLSSRARFERLGPTLAIALVPSGSPETLVITRKPNWRGVKSLDAILVLRRRHLTMLAAKRAIEAAMEIGHVTVEVPCVEDLAVLAGELEGFGFLATRREAGDITVKQLREKTGLSQEKFALAYGLDVNALRNWEQGRREPDRAARSYLQVIARAPEKVAAMLAGVVDAVADRVKSPGP